jgi:hypothetical protein
MTLFKSPLFKQCPKTGRITGLRKPEELPWILFPAVGFLALAWFLLRVAPKPSRASYPCQRVAAPLAAGFLAWLAGITGAGILFHQARCRLRQTRYGAAGLAIVVALAAVAWGALSLQSPAQAYTAHPANQPIGSARGLAPGRVVWVHRPGVTDWAGPGSGQYWYEHVHQARTDNMLALALQGYADTSTTAAAWDAVYRSFNGGAGYTPGEKIFIKINLTTSYAGGGSDCADADYNWIQCWGVTFDSIGPAPQLMHALLGQLVNVVGVAQSDITIGDPTGLFVNNMYDPLHDDFPDVVYLDNRGGNGRTRAEFSAVPFDWSDASSDGMTQDYVPAAIAEATYVINFAELKTHEGAGITVSAKNHYGSLIRTPAGALRGVPAGYFNLHDWLPGDTYRNSMSMTEMGHYRPLVDLMGSSMLGGKTVLYLVDAIFAGKNWNAVPSRWALAPFNGDWPSSILVSMDPVAIDSVGFDFLSQQWPGQALQHEGTQDYLHEAALADSPPSGTVYDPEHDGAPMASLGVHEHWNNPTDKQYTRNLGTGNGIELVYYLDHSPVSTVYLALAAASHTNPAACTVYLPLAVASQANPAACTAMFCASSPSTGTCP